MSKRVAFLFSGQGAQYPSMGHDFYEGYEEAKRIYDRADELLGKPFSKLIFEGPQEELTLTKNSQLAIFITSIAVLEVFRAQYPSLPPSLCAGLSLGEYSALVASSHLTFEKALPIVEARGRLMQEACEAREGVMHVVLGLELPSVQEVVDSMDGVFIANLNCPGQIVLSGTPEALARAGEKLKEAGARRIMALDVSGAFHSGLMQSAQDRLEPMINETELTSSHIGMVMNVPGGLVSDLDQMRANMIRQVTQPVYWQKGIETMAAEGMDLFVELGPGKTLAGMNKRIGIQEIPTISVSTVEDLQGVQVYATLT